MTTAWRPTCLRLTDGRLYHLCRLQDKAHLTHTEVLVVRCPFETKELLIAAAPDIFFDDDHYRGYRACWSGCPWSRPTNWTACCTGPAIYRRRGKKRKL